MGSGRDTNHDSEKATFGIDKPVMPTQLWKPNSIQLDAATDIGINFLRFKGNGNLPVFTHGQTAATSASDYKNLLRQRIKGLVVDTVRTTADPFIGTSSIDGLQVQSLQTALNNKMVTLQKRGYVSRFSFTVFCVDILRADGLVIVVILPSSLFLCVLPIYLYEKCGRTLHLFLV